ncbi:MAG: energy transducer TonB [Ferruginibacter sp.]
MRIDQILSADLLDLQFDNKNKAYGAYELRKFYKVRFIKSMAITFLVAGLLAVLVFSAKKKETLSFTVPDIATIWVVSDQVIPEIPPQIEQPKKYNQKVDAQKYVANIIVTQKEAEADKLANNMDKLAISNQTVTGDSGIELTVGAQPGAETTPALSIVSTATVNKTDIETPRSTAEVMPSYPGGMEALKRFLERNLQNPQDLSEGEVVSVRIRFIVGYDGKLKGFETIENGRDAFNKEVIRVLKKMKDWNPGKSNGENISVYYTIPVKFMVTN